MCEFLKVSRSMIYYNYVKKDVDTELENNIIKIFNSNKKVYGTRKIKKLLNKCVSRRKIGIIMNKYGLVSKYTTKIFKNHKTKVNTENLPNIVERNFDNHKPLEVIVSDLTYVRVKNSWRYLCAIIDLHNREIIGYSSGNKKDAQLVIQAFGKIQANLKDISIFHTDRGSEFKNKAIDELIKTFGIKRSLSAKGTPYDNAVSESTYHIIKTEFVDGESFNTDEELKYQYSDYVNWYNHVRIHGSLGYTTPVKYRERFISSANLDKNNLNNK